MDPKQELILIDTNIFVIDLRYKRDVNFKKNQAFLVEIAQSRSGFTTLANLMGLCGILSFNLNPMQLKGSLALFSGTVQDYSSSCSRYER